MGQLTNFGQKSHASRHFGSVIQRNLNVIGLTPPTLHTNASTVKHDSDGWMISSKIGVRLQQTPT
jgi:hypothetical protein